MQCTRLVGFTWSADQDGGIQFNEMIVGVLNRLCDRGVDDGGPRQDASAEMDTRPLGPSRLVFKHNIGVGMTIDAEQVSPNASGSMSRPSRKLRSLLVAAVAALALLTTTLGGASPAEAATSGPCYSNPSTTCRPYMSTAWAPWTTSTSPGPQYWTIAKGTRVDMQCWTTGATRLGTAKWFRVVSQSYPFTRGYVPATAVGQQVSVGHC